MANVNLAPTGRVLLGLWNAVWCAALVRNETTGRTWYRWLSGTAAVKAAPPTDYQLMPAYVAPPAPTPAVDPGAKLLGPYCLAPTVRAMGQVFVQYEDQFAIWLAKHAADEKLDAGTGLDRVGWYYYDRALILYREAMRTGNATTMARAHKVAILYRDILPNFDHPMYWSFIQGVALHYLITKDPKSAVAIQRLTKNCYDPYYLQALDGLPPPGEDNADCRTQARVLEHHVVAHHTGVAPYPNPWEDTRSYAVMAKAVLDDILKSQSLSGEIGYLFKQRSPFMAGLVHEAMILYHRLVSPDTRIFTAIERSAEYIWTNHWNPAGQGFIYDPGQADGTDDDIKPAPDLNMLIAPSFGWLYAQSKNPMWRDRGDLIFKGGVELAWLDGAKQFNQSYCFGPMYPALRI